MNTVVIGGDVRLSTETLKQAVVEGLRDAGGSVLDLGLVGPEEVYFATFHLGGVKVTASHNPMDYNGMTLVRKGAAGDTCLHDIQ